MAVIRILCTVAALSLALPAAAQTVPSTGPYSPVDGNQDHMIIMADGTRARTGPIGRVTVISLYSDAMMARNGSIARLDMGYEFRCGTTEYRTTGVSAYGTSGESIGDLPEASEWGGVTPDSPNVVVQAFACDGTRTTDTPAPTVEAMSAFYRGWLAGDYE